MKKFSLLLFSLFLTPVLGWTEGQTSAQFLELGGGARYIAMGEAAVAVADDANAIHWNPANLARVDDVSLSLMYGAYVESTNFQYFSYARPTDKWGSVGASIQSFSAGSIRETDDTGQEIGDFSPRDTAASLGWGRSLGSRFTLGLTGKFIHSKIINSASTWAVDAGLGWKREALQLGAVVRNVGGRLTHDRESNALPLSTHLGASYRFKRPLLLSSEAIYTKEAGINVGLGTEYAWNLKKSQLSLRGGYNSRTSDVPGFAGLSLGFGWKWSPIQLDYAWIPFGDLDQTHRISLTFAFGRKTARTVYNVNDLDKMMREKGNDEWTKPPLKFIPRKRNDSESWITPPLKFVPRVDPEASSIKGLKKPIRFMIREQDQRTMLNRLDLIGLDQQTYMINPRWEEFQ